MTTSSPQNRKRPLWQILLAPMLLLSLGAHALVLFTPVTPSDDDLVPPPEASEEDGIAITKIDAPKPRSARPPSTTNAVTSAKTTPRSPAPAAANTSQARGTGQTSNQSGQRSRDNRNSRGRRDRDSAPRRGQPSSGGNNRQRSSNASTGRPSVPALPPSPTAAKSPAQVAFEEYFETFGDYRGLQPRTTEEAAARQDRWLSGFTQSNVPSDPTAIQSVTLPAKIPYEAKICLPSAPAPAQVLVLVEANGELNEITEILQTTGYRGFDSAANNLIEAHSFPNNGSPQAYRAEVAVDYDHANCEWPPKVTTLPDSYFSQLQNYVGPTLTTPADFNAAKATWLETVAASDAIAPPAEGEALDAEKFRNFEPKVEYPLNICLPIAPKSARWGVVVSPDGALQGEPKVLRSTGYSNFDARSKELVSGFAFPASEAAQAYVVEARVDYNSLLCQKIDSEQFTVPATAAAASTAPTPANDSETDSDRPSSSTSQAVAFDPSRQTELQATGRQNLAEADFGRVNAEDPEFVGLIIESEWQEGIDQSVFLSAIDPESGPVPADGAVDAFVLMRNADLAPETLAELYGVETKLASGDYQGAPLYELSANGAPQLFASIVGMGSGDSSALIVLWPSDPRQASDNTPTSPQLETPPEDTPATETTPADTQDAEPEPDAEPPVEPNPRGLGMLFPNVWKRS